MCLRGLSLMNRLVVQVNGCSIVDRNWSQVVTLRNDVVGDLGSRDTGRTWHVDG